MSLQSTSLFGLILSSLYLLANAAPEDYPELPKCNIFGDKATTDLTQVLGTWTAFYTSDSRANRLKCQKFQFSIPTSEEIASHRSIKNDKGLDYENVKLKLWIPEDNVTAFFSGDASDLVGSSAPGHYKYNFLVVEKEYLALATCYEEEKLVTLFAKKLPSLDEGKRIVDLVYKNTGLKSGSPFKGCPDVVNAD